MGNSSVLEICGHTIPSDNNQTAISMAGISYQNSCMTGKQCAFLTKRLEKDHFFLKLGLEFQLQLSGHPVIVTDQPNLFMEYGVHPSLDEHCQHQTIFRELNISLACLPPYKRTVWDYSKSDVQSIRGSLQQTDWPIDIPRP